MREDLDKKLVQSFPILYGDRYGDMRQTCMCWGIDTDDGWFQIIWNLSEKLEKLIKEEWDKFNLEEQKQYQEWYGGNPFRASQVKEKYATLRFYMISETDEMSKLIEQAENESAITCEICGKLGEVHVKYGWYKTICSKCAKGTDFKPCENARNE